MNKICFYSKFRFMPLHVSSISALIIRWSKLHYTASGIITPISYYIYRSIQPTCWKKICFTISFISCLYMFRAYVRSSSGGQNCITQSLLSSHPYLIIFISVFNQLDEQNLFYIKFQFMPLHVSSTCAPHHQVVKIALHSIWYHHTYRWQSGAQVESGLQF